MECVNERYPVLDLAAGQTASSQYDLLLLLLRRPAGLRRSMHATESPLVHRQSDLISRVLHAAMRLGVEGSPLADIIHKASILQSGWQFSLRKGDAVQKETTCAHVDGLAQALRREQ